MKPWPMPNCASGANRLKGALCVMTVKHATARVREGASGTPSTRVRRPSRYIVPMRYSPSSAGLKSVLWG